MHHTRSGLRVAPILAVLALAVALPPGPAAAQSFDYGDALEKAVWFFDANRCGRAADVTAGNVFDWRGACHTGDGGQASPALDLTGGFHDAGDHVKFGLPQGFAASVLGWSLYEYRAEFNAAGVTPKALSTLKYFTDYFLRSHPNATTFYYQVGDGNIDHGFWGSPEVQTGSRPVLVTRTSGPPAVDILGQHAAALALMSLNYRSTDAAYANRCLTAARELFAMAQAQLASCSGANCRGTDGGGGAFYRSTSHFDDLAWGAIWLSIATGDQGFLANVDGWISQPNDTGDNPYQKRWTMAWDDMTMANLLKMHQLTGRQKYRDGLLWNLQWYRDTLQKTPAGLPWLDQWGVLRYANAEAGLGYLAYKLFGYDDFFTMGNRIVSYTLGVNPRNGSYVTNYLSNPPIHPHHRANEPVRGAGTNGLVGALVGGPALNDSWTDNVDDFRANEVALDYNASWVFSLAGRLYFANGGQPGTPPPPPPPPPMSPPGNGTGLTGSYFQGTALAGAPLLTRTDATINFNLAGGSPAPGVVPADQFSVRWEGEVEARSDEVYTFYVIHDDGARLWVNDQLVIDNWTDHAAIEDSGSITLALGQRYPIRLEFYENGGDAVATLSWSTPAGIPEKVIIPQSQLYTDGEPPPPPIPNFSLSASPASVSVTRGSMATSTVAITRSGGFTGAVDLSVSGLPSGVTASFSPDPTTGNSSVLTLTASSTATLGTVNATIGGSGTPGTRSTPLSVTVNPAAVLDFSLSASPASLSINRGATGTTTVTITRTGGFTGSVDLSVSGLPAGVAASFSPDPTTGTSSVLTLTASSTAALGTVNATISGTGTPGTRSTPLTLTINQGGGGGGTGGVTVTTAIVQSSPWYNDQAVRLANTGTLTALSITVVVQKTPGLTANGMYNTVGGAIQQTRTETATAITYRWTLGPGQTLPAGTGWQFSAQTGGNGTAHSFAGDTWTVTYTTGGTTFTQTGGF